MNKDAKTATDKLVDEIQKEATRLALEIAQPERTQKSEDSGDLGYTPVPWPESDELEESED